MGAAVARVDDQPQRDRSAEVCGERGLHLFAPFLALLLCGAVGSARTAASSSRTRSGPPAYSAFAIPLS